jgi:hypothetical protein
MGSTFEKSATCCSLALSVITFTSVAVIGAVAAARIDTASTWLRMVCTALMPSLESAGGV